VPSPFDIYTGFKEHSSTLQSLTYSTEKLVETVGTAVTVLEKVMSMVAHLESVELYVTDAIKKGVDFDWIRSVGCSLHYHGIIIIFIYCNWVVTRWQWLFYIYTKHEIGYC